MELNKTYQIKSQKLISETISDLCPHNRTKDVEKRVEQVQNKNSSQNNRLIFCLFKNTAGSFYNYPYKKQIAIIFTPVLFTLATWHFLLQQQIQNTIKQTTALQQQINLLNSNQNKNILTPLELALQQTINEVNNIKNHQNNLTRFFSNMHTSELSSGVYLTKLLINKDNIKLFGKTETIIGVVKFIQGIAKSSNNYYKNFLIKKITKQNSEYAFELAA